MLIVSLPYNVTLMYGSRKVCVPSSYFIFLLDHSGQQSIDLVLPVAKITTLHKVVGLLPPPTSWVVQLETHDT